jgi:pSer/pThr/pTyr-binding forkhead associated (FHA) protein
MAAPVAAPQAAHPPRVAAMGMAPSFGGDFIACERCGNRCLRTEAFCKHCGARLADQLSGGHAVAAASPEASSEIAAPVELTHKVGGDGEPFPLADSAVADRAHQAGPPAPAQGVSAPARVERERSQTPTARDGERASAAPERRPPPPPTSRPPVAQEVTGKLVVIVEDGSEGRALELRGRQMDIGSAEGDIVLSEDRYLSPRHARFFRQDGHWYLRDLGSVNGVYRRLRKPTPLRNSDLVLLGLEVLQFELVDHAERGLGHAIQHGVLVFGSPATTRRARLCQRTVEGVVRDIYHLVSDETTIGRETGDIVFTSDPFMSRRHAAITWDEDAQEYVLADLSSSNGTYLAIRDDVRLDDGEFIRLGQHLFRVDLPRGAKAR